MYTYIHFLDDPKMIGLIFFLTVKDIFYMTQVSRSIQALNIQCTIKQEWFKCIERIFKYYERYYHIPFYTSRRTPLHMLKIDFIYQNFYIFTNKSYIILLNICGLPLRCSYKIKHRYLKKIFKFYTTLVCEYYSRELLCRALHSNKIILLDLII